MTNGYGAYSAHRMVINAEQDQKTGQKVAGRVVKAASPGTNAWQTYAHPKASRHNTRRSQIALAKRLNSDRFPDNGH